MPFSVFIKEKYQYALRFVLAVILSPLYVFSVDAGVLTGKLGFLQPLIVGTMALPLQFILLDIIFFLVRYKSTDNYILAFGFIAALLFCQFAVHAGWVVYESVIISALTVALSPKGKSHFIIRWTVLILFLGLGLS